jgi:hypothetical protein
LGRACGTAPDGCGGTLECGICGGATPSCKNGTCASCADACPGCFCLNLTTGDTRCAQNLAVNCGDACSSNANCTDPEVPLCAVSFGDASGTTTFADQCGGLNPGVVNVCTNADTC